jgi:formylglycine-generating enzyme required for sulfatase activity
MILRILILLLMPFLLIFFSTFSIASANQPLSTLDEPTKSEPQSSHSQEGMVSIQGGEFTAGAVPEIGFRECARFYKDCKLDWFTDETPHTETVNSFFIDRNEVTQAEFERVMGSNPSKSKGDNLPVDSVTWDEAKAYCQKLGKRLPTEWEWEYAAMGGRLALYPWGNEVESGKANFCDLNCEFGWKADQFNDGYKMSSPIGTYPPNDYGLYDMAGNVWEWTSSNSADSDEKKVIRGGSWDHAPGAMRSALRYERASGIRYQDNGFRCVW